MTGPGFLIAVQIFDEERREQQRFLTLDQKRMLWEFANFCMELDESEDRVVGDAGRPYTSDLPKDAHA